jgi:hypothetical protein
MGPRYGCLLVLLLLAGPAASAEETIWLRGRGSDVWIERGDAAREPRDARRGLTRVATSSDPEVSAGAAADASRPPAVVVLDGPHWASADHYAHDFTPRFYPSHGSCRRHSTQRPRYRAVRPWSRSSGYHHGLPLFAGHPRGGRGHPGRGFLRHRRGDRHAARAGGPVHRNAGPYGGGVRSGGYVVRGGAYRRVR